MSILSWDLFAATVMSKLSNVKSGGVQGPIRDALAHFPRCILEDREPMVSAAEGRHSLEVVMAIKELCRTGKPVQISP